MPTRNAISAHAQGFMVYDKLLLPILKAFQQYTQYMLPEVLYVCMLCIVAEQSVTVTNSSQVIPPASRQQSPVLCRDHHMVCMYYCTWLPIFWRVVLSYFGGREGGGGKVLHKVHTLL